MNPNNGMSDAQAMANLIGGLPPVDPQTPFGAPPQQQAPAPQPQIDLNFEATNPAPDPFGTPGLTPQAPAPQAPAPYAPPAATPLYPQAQPQPVAPPAGFQSYPQPYAAPQPFTPPVPQQYAPPQAPAPQPGQPMVPGFDPNAIPLTPYGLPVGQAPQAPAPQGDQMPPWATQLLEQVKQSQAQQQQQPESWVPTNFQDIDKRIQEQAAAIAQQTITEAETRRQQAVAAQEQQRQQADAAIDTSLNQLRTTGYLPPITNPNDPNDPGRLAQTELIAYTLASGSEDVARMAPALYALHQSGYAYDYNTQRLVRRGSQTAAAQAPIAGAAPGAAAPAGQAGPSHQDLINLDMNALMDRAQQQIK